MRAHRRQINFSGSRDLHGLYLDSLTRRVRRPDLSAGARYRDDKSFPSLSYSLHIDSGVAQSLVLTRQLSQIPSFAIATHRIALYQQVTMVVEYSEAKKTLYTVWLFIDLNIAQSSMTDVVVQNHTIYLENVPCVRSTIMLQRLRFAKSGVRHNMPGKDLIVCLLTHQLLTHFLFRLFADQHVFRPKDLRYENVSCPKV